MAKKFVFFCKFYEKRKKIEKGIKIEEVKAKDIKQKQCVLLGGNQLESI